MPTPHLLLRTLVPIVAFALVACAGDGLQSPEPPPPEEVATPGINLLPDEGEPVTCSPGSYEDGGVCFLAPIGYYVNISGATFPFPCPLAKTTSGHGSTSVSQCIVVAPPGSFVSPDTHLITPCPAGQYQPFAGDSECFFAPQGSYVPGTGATGYLQCPSGKFSSSFGASSCTPAPAGYIVSFPGATFPVACAAGTYQPNEGMTSCLPSPAGSFVPVTGAQQATPCSAGSYQQFLGQESCLAAPAGYHVPGTGATLPIQCAAGTYQPLTGKSECLPAPIGSYVAGLGATEATPCPAGATTTATGATSSAQCVTTFAFTGFFAPVDNAPALNVTNAGSAIPVKFSLGGNQGLNVMAEGYPTVQAIACDASATLDVLEETVTAGKSSLSYDATTDRYTYVWKSDKSWTLSCRRLTVRLTDGTTKTADFMFK